MAAERSHVNSFLFTGTDGSPLIFYIRPCEMKAKIRPLVESRGGLVTSSRLSKQSLRLAEPGSNFGHNDCISTDFIFDSIKKNICLDINDYRLKEEPSQTGRSSKATTMPSKTTSTIVTTGRAKGRKKYTQEEDKAIVDFIDKNRGRGLSVSGNKLWKIMEDKKVTDHAWQSMRQHYLDFIQSTHKENKKSPQLQPPALEFMIKTEQQGDELEKTAKKPMKRMHAAGQSVKQVDAKDEDISRPNKHVCKCVSFGNDNPWEKQPIYSQEQEVVTSCDELQSKEQKTKQKRLDVHVHVGDKVHKGKDVETGSPGCVKDDEPMTSNEMESETESDDDFDEMPQQTRSGNQGSLACALLLHGLNQMQPRDNCLTPGEMLRSLFMASGSVADAESYIETGQMRQGIEPWRQHEDEIILSRDVEGIDELIKKRGVQAVEDRQHFVRFFS